MHIRAAVIEDIEKILELEKQVFDIHFNARPDRIKKIPANYDRVKSIIESNDSKIFVAINDKDVLGYCTICIRSIKDHVMLHDMINIVIDDMCIDENQRNKGIGKFFFEEVKNFAKNTGAKNIELNVWEFNENAIKFYEKIGMKTITRKMEFKVE